MFVVYAFTVLNAAQLKHPSNSIWIYSEISGLSATCYTLKFTWLLAKLHLDSAHSISITVSCFPTAWSLSLTNISKSKEHALYDIWQYLSYKWINGLLLYFRVVNIKLGVSVFLTFIFIPTFPKSPSVFWCLASSFFVMWFIFEKIHATTNQTVFSLKLRWILNYIMNYCDKIKLQTFLIMLTLRSCVLKHDQGLPGGVNSVKFSLLISM